MLPNVIDNSEMLYRLVLDKQDYWNDSGITSLVFWDSLGASVDRDGGRFEKEIIRFFDQRMSTDMGMIKISAGHCRDSGTHPVSRPKEDNLYHAEIHQSETEVEITSRRCRKALVRNAQLLRPPLRGREAGS